MKIRTILAATGLALVAFGAQAANLVTNGSFESNAQARAPGKWLNFSNLEGWTGGTKGIELRNNVAGTAQNGSHFVELDTTRNSSMYQDISGTGLVTLSFFYAARPGTSAATNGLNFQFGAFTGILAGVAGGSTHNWLQYTLNNFLLNTSGTTRLSFFATGTSDGVGTSLDNISVEAVSPVPEVETYAMLLAGLGLLGVASRRRRNKALTA